MLKDRISKTSGWQFHKWPLGPEIFRDFRGTGPSTLKGTVKAPAVALLRLTTLRGTKTAFLTLIFKYFDFRVIERGTVAHMLFWRSFKRKCCLHFSSSCGISELFEFL